MLEVFRGILNKLREPACQYTYLSVQNRITVVVVVLSRAQNTEQA